MKAVPYFFPEMLKIQIRKGRGLPPFVRTFMCVRMEGIKKALLEKKSFRLSLLSDSNQRPRDYKSRALAN